MNLGRAQVVLKNPLHEACHDNGPFLAVGVCSSWAEVSQSLLPWSHSIMNEPRYVSPYQAALDAFCLQWEVCHDLSTDGLTTFCLAQTAPLPVRVTTPALHKPHLHSQKLKHVKFEEQVKVFFGDDDGFAMHEIIVAQNALLNWESKPWSKKRIRKKRSMLGSCLAPLSEKAVSSRHSLHLLHKSPMPLDMLSWEDSADDDVASFMHRIAWKQDPTSDRDIAPPIEFANGQGIPPELFDDQPSQGSVSSGSQDSQNGHNSHASASGIHPPTTVGDRQEVVLYHLQDAPIRTFLEWNDYDQMITEIAYHFSVNPATVVDAYEVNTPLRGFADEMVPVIVHLFPDIAVGQNARLVLFDIEIHGHRTELHYVTGPATNRFVLPIPEWVDRDTVLLLADLDRYCRLENGRCLVWHDGFRWADYDSHMRRIAHGDHIRIAVPPTDRFDCPTSNMIRWTQSGLSDQEVLDRITYNDANSGYSPSLLADDEVSALATDNLIGEDITDTEDEVFHAMQLQVILADDDVPSDASEFSPIPQDWLVDLQRFAQYHESTCERPRHDDILFSVYTWFLDHETRRMCCGPKLAFLGRSPNDWEEDILFPWRHVILPDEPIFIDMVMPMAPRADIEDHAAHMLITQRPRDLSSTLLALEYPDDAQKSVFVRFAIAIPKVSTRYDIDQLVPLFASTDDVRLHWENPMIRNDEEFPTRNGMCIKIRVLPDPLLGTNAEATSLIQVGGFLKPLVPRTSSDFVRQDGCVTGPVDSFTDEFLEAIDAAQNAVETETPPLDPRSIDAQPAAFQMLWEGFLQIETLEGQQRNTGRVESWYLHHATFTRCHASRVTLLANDFLQWRDQLVATWRDKIQNPHDLDFDVVNPEPEDRAIGVLAQVIITEHKAIDLRSTVLSVYDTDSEAERNPYTFAVVLPGRINLDRLLNWLHLSSDCPPQQMQNLCSLWFGRIPIGQQHEVNLFMGTALRLVLSRGIRLDVPYLLTLDHEQLRRILQRSIHSVVFDRPPDPSFVPVPTSIVSTHPVPEHLNDQRSTWIPVLEQHFNQGHTLTLPEGTPELQVVTWYLNYERDFHCSQPKVVRLDSDTFSWRTDLIFPWRDRFIRASPVEVHALSSLVSVTCQSTPMPHVILVQGLPTNCFAVLVTVCGTEGLQGFFRQFAHLFQGRLSGHDLLRLAIPVEHRHRPAIIQMAGQTYFPDDFLMIQMGTHLTILVTDENVDIQTEQIADAFSMMQQSVYRSKEVALVPPTPMTCKPADFDLPDDLPVSMVRNVRWSRPPRPHHDGEMDWSVDLWEHVLADGETNLWNGDVTLSVTTWYIHHDRRIACHRPRQIQLPGNPITWVPEFRATWSDMMDRRLPFSIHLVRPRPPGFRVRNSACHIVLEQAPKADKRVAVLTALVANHDNDGIIQGAFSVDLRINLPSVIRTMEITFYCTSRQCELFHQRRRVPGDGWFDVYQGMSVYVRIRPPELEPDDVTDSLASHFDDLTLMQTHMQPHPASRPEPSLNANAPPFCPTSVPIATQPEHIQDLHHCWNVGAFVGEEESRALHVLTWFVAPGNGLLSCFASQSVVLYEDFMQWERLLKAKWTHLIDPAVPTHFTLVHRELPNLEHSIGAHVIMTQHPLPEMSSPLFTVYDPAVSHGHPFRFVTTIADRSSAVDIIAASNYARDCQSEFTQCQVWIEKFAIPHGHHVAVRDGTVLVLQITRSGIQPNWNPPLQPSLTNVEELDGVGFVQLSAKRSTERAEDIDEERAIIKINMQPAVSAFEWIDQHLFLPTFIVPDGAQLMPQSQSWLNLPVWEFGVVCNTICIYMDGSYLSDDVVAGFAVAAFMQGGGQWYQAGMISGKLPATTAYSAEAVAALVANKFAFDLIKQVTFGQASPCSLWFGYDSLTVGQQMTGTWHGLKMPHATSVTRSLYRTLSARYGITPTAWHIRSHQGEAGNELVDALATAAAKQGGSHDVLPFLHHVLQLNFVQALEWMWALFEPGYRPYWHGLSICIPKHPMTCPDEEVFPNHPASGNSVPADTSSGRLSLRLGTCNVLTLKGKDTPSWGLEGVARQHMVLTQFHAQGITMLALQETRLRKLYRAQDPRYVLVKSAATSSGCFGIMIGLSKKHPHGWIKTPGGPEVPVYFQERHVSIIVALPRVLIIRLSTPVLRCIVVAGHAPHTGHSDDEVKQWWDLLGQQIPAKYNDWPRILLCDANARVGSIATSFIGDFQAESETSKSEFFRGFLQDNGLWLPATFAKIQKGAGGTWRHPNGAWLRGDYIGLPVQWAYDECSAFVDEQIDVSTAKEDHRTAVVFFAGPSPVFQARSWKRSFALSDSAIADMDPADLAKVVRPTFEVDVHTHAHRLEQQILQHLPKPRWKPSASPRKTSMSPETWELVTTKKDWKNHLWKLQLLQKQTILQACFQVLKAHSAPQQPSLDWSEVRVILCHQHRLIAQAMQHLQAYGRQVVKALRRDDAIFFQSLAQDAGMFVRPHQAKQLWQVIRRSLPRFQQRRLQAPPEQIEALEEQWHPYFQKLEAGCPINAADLVQECHSFQLTHGSVKTNCELSDLPSLQQVEDMFRRTQTGKSTGLDPIASGLFHRFPVETARLFYDLLLKVFVWQAEPLAYKGGVMAVIPKRIGASDASHFRGIMLLPTVAKRLHALLRSQTVRLIEHVKPAGQIGGFQHQQVGFASQALRTFCRIAQHRGCSTGVLFVDLSNAFHRLVRELVCGIGVQADVQAVLETIEQNQGSTAGLKAWLAFPGLLERLGASQLLIQLMREVHTNTWHVLANQPGITKTRRGTRPGSPLADVVFHVLMMDVVIEINAWIAEQTAYQTILNDLDLQFDSIVWSDDLAIPWCTRDAELLVPPLQDLLQIVDRCFTRRGFDLNMGKGKTGAVLTFKGRGAPSQRKQYLLSDPGGFWCRLDRGRQTWLHVTASYRHLGTMFASRLDFGEELRYRLGQAASAFGAMRRQVFCNRYIPVHTRLQLFHALVCTRLYFGLGAWHTPLPSNLNHMKRALAHFLRCILSAGKKPTGTRLPDGQVFSQARFHDPRIRLAQDRLLFAHKFFQHGPAFAHHLMHKEYQFLPQSWISGLMADLLWLRNTLPDSIPEGWTTSLTDAIEYWQSGAPGWQATIKRAGRQHWMQETMMHEVHQWHRKFFRTLDQHGASFSPAFFGSKDGDGDFHCPCGRCFTTAQGLFTHRRKVHGILSQEHDLLSGATCPVCMTHFWTTQCLQQHLAYISRRTGHNACYQTLRKHQCEHEYEPVKFPSQVLGMNRIESIPVEGPLIPFPATPHAETLVWRQEISRLEQQLAQCQFPPEPIRAAEQLRHGLTQATWAWFRRFCDSSYDLTVSGPLEDFWFDYLATWPPELDDWYADRLLRWGQHDLPDVVAEFQDGEAEGHADNALYEVSKGMPRCQMRDRILFLQQCIQRVELAFHSDVVHRQQFDYDKARKARLQRADPDAINSLYQQQTEWHEDIRKIKWEFLPKDVTTPLMRGIDDRPTFFVVHLFSGRRRQYDIHWHLTHMAEERGLHIVVLSMDTAVSPYYGDLTTTATSWNRLVQLYEAGRISATICGAPCETFSAARHAPPPVELSEQDKKKWPRPLRTFARLFGLEGLRPKELRQCKQGTAFMMQGVMVCIWHLIYGGIFLSEHPAPPADADRASVWTSAIIQLLLQHPDIALRIFNQWKWGAPVCKPTGLFSLRLPFLPRSMHACADVNAKYPTKVAIGKDHDGSFRTAVCKEYPPFFAAGMAKAVVDQISHEYRQRSCRCPAASNFDPDLEQWLSEALEASATIFEGSTHLPDYQGQ